MVSARRILPKVAFALAGVAAGGALAAQTTWTFRCRYTLSEDGASWREDLAVTTILRDVIDIRPAADAATDGIDTDYGEAWLIPGLIDLHTHLLLRPYNEMSWDDQVRKESTELRSIRATVHARATLRAGFVAIRDLGTEGADFADVALRQAIRDDQLLGPEIFATTRAIAKTGRYGPAPDDAAVRKGAQMVAGIEGVREAVRQQIAAGADWIKVYADYPAARGEPATPTFSPAELEALCAEATRASVSVAAHATSDEGIRAAVEAGVRTIEHGAGASEATLRLMAEKGVVLCPCLAANEAIVRYAGHRGPNVERLNAAKIGFQRALAAGVRIACGSDAGVFAHGDNVRELELMVEYGMTPAQALAAATSVAAQVLGRPKLGVVREGARGLVVLRGDPLKDITNLRRVRAVILEGDVSPQLMYR